MGCTLEQARAGLSCAALVPLLLPSPLQLEGGFEVADFPAEARVLLRFLSERRLERYYFVFAFDYLLHQRGTCGVIRLLLFGVRSSLLAAVIDEGLDELPLPVRIVGELYPGCPELVEVVPDPADQLPLQVFFKIAIDLGEQDWLEVLAHLVQRDHLRSDIAVLDGAQHLHCHLLRIVVEVIQVGAIQQPRQEGRRLEQLLLPRGTLQPLHRLAGRREQSIGHRSAPEL